MFKNGDAAVPAPLTVDPVGTVEVYPPAGKMTTRSENPSSTSPSPSKPLSMSVMTNDNSLIGAENVNVISCPPSVFGVCANVRAFPVIFPVGPAWTLRLEDNAVLLPKKVAELSDIVTPPAVAVVNVVPTAKLLKLIVLVLHVGADVGLAEGLSLGLKVGFELGLALGLALGFPLGISDGLALGLRLGPPDGFELGLALGLALGFLLGISDGLALGFPLDISDGVALGFPLGISDGLSLGLEVVGNLLGLTDGLDVGVSLGVDVVGLAVVGDLLGLAEGLDVGVFVGD